MIRPFSPQDIDVLVALWLDASVAGHPFISRSHWLSLEREMREVRIPYETYVFERDGAIRGFISLIGDYVEGLFVAPEAQRQGIGTKLLDYAKALQPGLSVTVFSRNTGAVSFYMRHGFVPYNTAYEPEINEPKQVMGWIANAA